MAKQEADGLIPWQPKGKRSRAIPIPTITVDVIARLHTEAGEHNPYVLISDNRLDNIRASKAGGNWSEARRVARLSG